MFTCHLNRGEEVEGQKEPEDHCANGGPGLQPLLPEEPRVWGEQKMHLLKPQRLRHPQPPPTNLFPSGHMIKGLKPQGIMTATFHTGYYIVLMTLDFSSSFKDKLFLSLKKNVSYSMMGSWDLFSIHVYQSWGHRGLEFSRNWRADEQSVLKEEESQSQRRGFRSMGRDCVKKTTRITWDLGNMHISVGGVLDIRNWTFVWGIGSPVEHLAHTAQFIPSLPQLASRNTPHLQAPTSEHLEGVSWAKGDSKSMTRSHSRLSKRHEHRLCNRLPRPATAPLQPSSAGRASYMESSHWGGPTLLSSSAIWVKILYSTASSKPSW